MLQQQKGCEEGKMKKKKMSKTMVARFSINGGNIKRVHTGKRGSVLRMCLCKKTWNESQGGWVEDRC